MRWWELFRHAIAGAVRARLRSALTCAGIAIGCGALVSMVALAVGLQRQMELPFKRLGLLNDIHVTPADDVEEGSDEQSTKKEPPASAALPLDAAALEVFRKIPGVKYAYPDMRLTDVGIKRDKHSVDTLAIALPREAALSDVAGGLLSAGNFFSLDDSPEVLLGEGLLKDLGFKMTADAIGQTVEISASGLKAKESRGEFEFQNQRTSVKIVGVFEAPGFASIGPRGPGQMIVLPVDLMQKLPGLVERQLRRVRREGESALDSYNQVVVRAENPVEVPQVARAIEKQGFHTSTMISRFEEARTAFLILESLLTAVGSVALVIAGLGIANTLLMTVLERYEEIGLYKAIGATDGDVRLMFLAEAAVLGLVGGLAGLALAGVVCWGLQIGVNGYLARQGVEKAVVVFNFPWTLLGGAVLFSTVVSIVSGLYPASRAARVDPIKALRRA